ncbi:MAG: sigma-54-dependent Fis family transcriptional regulator [Deltaproteobacteria bacterium]|nr:MAG: sigma-54-dependent Fis family transcriptional regulator [Deltaproteobacteria bacterium]
MAAILLASPSLHDVEVLEALFRKDFEITRAKDRSHCFTTVKEAPYACIFIDVDWLGGMEKQPQLRDYRAALERLRSFPSTEVVVIAAQAEIRKAVRAVQAGATDYLTRPLNASEIEFVWNGVGKERKLRRELDELRNRLWKDGTYEITTSRNPLMQRVYEKICSVAPTRATVLLLGETGTGKGVLARLIHRLSNRASQPFISVHCGALADTLLESELFGHERGAFTGAIRRKIGKFEIAQGGTIFLDEIGTISAATQIKLLQVLQERKLQRVGGEEDIEIDVRIITATNHDLAAMCEEGHFRKDLFYRLNVFPIETVPLRKRLEDLPLFVEIFLQRLNEQYGKGIHSVDPCVMEAFTHYRWPGNIRELENLIERAYILEATATLKPESFPLEFFEQEQARATVPCNPMETLAQVRSRGIEEIERQYLKGLLARHKGRIRESAATAGIGVRQLHKLLTKYGIRKEEYKKAQD